MTTKYLDHQKVNRTLQPILVDYISGPPKSGHTTLAAKSIIPLISNDDRVICVGATYRAIMAMKGIFNTELEAFTKTEHQGFKGEGYALWLAANVTFMTFNTWLMFATETNWSKATHLIMDDIGQFGSKLNPHDLLARFKSVLLLGAGAEESQALLQLRVDGVYAPTSVDPHVSDDVSIYLQSQAQAAKLRRRVILTNVTPIMRSHDEHAET